MAEQNSRLDPHFWLSPRKAETEVLAVRDAFIKADPANALDPHFWLSPRKAETEVLAVRDAFIKADPANAAAYEKNAADYIERLKELDMKMAAVTQNAQIKTFITTHAAFGHLAADYGLKQISIMGLETDFHYGAVAAVGAFSGGAEQTGWRYACGKY